MKFKDSFFIWINFSFNRSENETIFLHTCFTFVYLFIIQFDYDLFSLCEVHYCKYDVVWVKDKCIWIHEYNSWGLKVLIYGVYSHMFIWDRVTFLNNFPEAPANAGLSHEERGYKVKFRVHFQIVRKRKPYRTNCTGKF